VEIQNRSTTHKVFEAFPCPENDVLAIDETSSQHNWCNFRQKQKWSHRGKIQVTDNKVLPARLFSA